MISVDLVGWESVIPNIDKVRFKSLSSDGKHVIIQALEKCDEYSKLYFLDTRVAESCRRAIPIELNIFSGYNDMIGVMGGMMGGDGIFYCGMWNDIEEEISILCIDLEHTKRVSNILNVPLGQRATNTANLSYKACFGTFQGTTDIHGNVYLLLKGTSLILFIDIRHQSVDIIHHPENTRGTYIDIVCLQWNHNGNSYVYGIPDSATKVLCINSIDQSTFHLPLELEPDIQSQRYSGYVVANEGMTIYCVPFNSRKVLCIEETIMNTNNNNERKDDSSSMSPSTKCIQMYYICDNGPSGFQMEFKNKWSCGVRDRGQFIYCLPYHHTAVLKIDTWNKSIGYIHIKMEGFHKQIRSGGFWKNGILGRDGNIYGLPDHARHVLRIDSPKQTASLMDVPWQEENTIHNHNEDIHRHALKCEFSYANRHGSIVAFNRFDDDDRIIITYPDIWTCMMLLFELCKQKRAQVISSSCEQKITTTNPNDATLYHWLFCELGEEYLFRTIVSFV